MAGRDYSHAMEMKPGAMKETPANTAAVEYKGKRTQRPRGHERRQAILRAALKIIAEEGVRAVRHRAVAKEAGVPLAATTYYFKDINELIYDAFAYFAAEGDKLKSKLEQRSFAALAELTATPNRDAQTRLRFIEHLTRFLVEHIEEQVSHVDNRMVENAFYLRALYDTELAKMLSANRDAMREKIHRFFVSLELHDPQSDTEIFLALIYHLEYELLAARQRGGNGPDAARVMRNFIDKLIPLAE